MRRRGLLIALLGGSVAGRTATAQDEPKHALTHVEIGDGLEIRHDDRVVRLTGDEVMDILQGIWKPNPLDMHYGETLLSAPPT